MFIKIKKLHKYEQNDKKQTQTTDWSKGTNGKNIIIIINYYVDLDHQKLMYKIAIFTIKR